jgi:putative acetyltransferase
MSLITPDGVSLRPFLPNDTAAICELINTSIMELSCDDYNQDQCTAWANSLSDEKKLATRLADNVTLLALKNDIICGFITLKDNTQIDLLFTAPHFAKHGIATFLCGAIEMLSTGRKATKLTVDASDTALSLFITLKFTPMQRNTVTINGQWISNTTMHKQLNSQTVTTQ